MRISDWISDVCSSDLIAIFDLLEMEAKTGIASPRLRPNLGVLDPTSLTSLPAMVVAANGFDVFSHACESLTARPFTQRPAPKDSTLRPLSQGANPYSDIACLEARSEEHTSELQSLMRISYAVFCLKKKKKIIH